MFFVKAVTVVIAGVLTLMTARRLLNEVNAAKVRVKPRPSDAVTRLRQDPATGIYYPVE